MYKDRRGVSVEHDEIERRLTRIEKLLLEAQRESVRLRLDLGLPLNAEEKWARMMLDVLQEVESRGGAVPREELLEIGERHAYNRRGMAGFYQELLILDEGMAKLTDIGRLRLKVLRQRFGA